MKQSKILSSVIIAVILGLQHLSAQTKLASTFGDHMVLQRNTEAAIWGNDKPNTKVSIIASWGKSIAATTDKSGNWKASISTDNAGGPYTITVQGTTKVLLNDVLLGEVWLCSGQSNMEMPVKGFLSQPVNGSQEAIMNSKNNQIRLFDVKRKISAEPLSECEGSWAMAEPQTVQNYSATAYFFGRLLQQQLGVPIGLITSSWGGTRAEAWTPRETLTSAFPELNEKLNDKLKYDQKSPTALFNGMIQPIIPFTIKGAIWYQGESNKKEAEQYSRLFPAMIKSWRAKWNIGDFPFYFVQISTLAWGGEDWVKLQQAQLKTMKSVPNTGMAVTNDIGEETCIHPARKTEVGERLAYWALAKTYGFDFLQYSGPIYKSKEVKDGKVILTFDFASNGLTSKGKELANFEIAGKDRVFKPAKAIIVKDNLIVWSESVTEPVDVRYGWKSFFEGSLFNTAGLPASGFDTGFQF